MVTWLLLAAGKYKEGEPALAIIVDLQLGYGGSDCDSVQRVDCAMEALVPAGTEGKKDYIRVACALWDAAQDSDSDDSSSQNESA